MIGSTHWPEAIFGGLLWGDKAVRFIYTDEAGTSANEPVTIVVGIIVDADRELLMAEALVREILGSVPPKYQPGFVFHATEVWGSPKYRDDWGAPDRLGLLRRMMGVPRRLKLPISFGIMRRGSAPAFPPLKHPKAPKMSSAQFEHLMAFGMCLAKADKYIRDHAGIGEVATVVAEDVPEMRRLLAVMPQILRDNPIVLSPECLTMTDKEEALGYRTQEGDCRVTRIRKAVHFVKKNDDPLTQVADACAFAFRRYFSGQSRGEELARAVFGNGPLPPLNDFSSAASAGTFSIRQ
jgi:hypothetical protein